LFGSSLHSVALPFQILAIGGGALQLGIGIAIGSISSMILVLFGGAIVDRLPRRRIILLTDLVSGSVVSLIGVLGVTGALRIEHLYVEAAILGAALAFFNPAITAIIPEFVPRDVLVSANALRSLSRNTARIGGPAVGGVLVAALGPSPAFLIDGATFFVSYFALLRTRPVSVTAARPGRLLQQVRAGLHFTLSKPWIWVTVAGFAVMNAAIFGPLQVALPILVRDALGADAQAYGALLAAMGVGAVVGDLSVGAFRVRRTGVTMYGLAALTGCSLAGFGIAPHFPVLVLLAATAGCAIAAFGVLWDGALQRHVPDEFLGRVASVDSFGSMLLGPVAPLVFAGLVSVLGPLVVFPIGGLVVVMYSMGALLVRSIRQLE